MSDSDFHDLFEIETLTQLFHEKFAGSSIRGIDNKDSIDFATDLLNNLEYIKNAVTNGNYKFTPYLELLKTKGKNSTPRIIAIPSIRDRIVLHQAKEHLKSKLKEKTKQELANTIVNRIAEKIKNNQIDKQNAIIKIDLKSFFDTIPHKSITSALKFACGESATKLIEKSIKNKCIPKGANAQSVKNNNRGVYQGLATSNILASIHMHPIDSFFKSNRRIHYFRYVDDILIVCKNRSRNYFYKLAIQKLTSIGLKPHKLNSGKTTITTTASGFDYLGYHFKDETITVRHNSRTKLLNSIAKEATRLKYKTKTIRTMGELTAAIDSTTEIINEIITGAYSNGRRYGWIAFYSQINDTSLLRRIDQSIQSIIMKNPNLAARANSIKKIQRAFYEIKFSPESGYIYNYDKIDTPLKKRNYLLTRGRISEQDHSSMSDHEICRLYEMVKDEFLSRLYMDDSLRS